MSSPSDPEVYRQELSTRRALGILLKNSGVAMTGNNQEVNLSVFGEAIGYFLFDGSFIPVFRPNWHRDEPIEETDLVEPETSPEE